MGSFKDLILLFLSDDLDLGLVQLVDRNRQRLLSVLYSHQRHGAVNDLTGSLCSSHHDGVTAVDYLGLALFHIFIYHFHQICIRWMQHVLFSFQLFFHMLHKCGIPKTSSVFSLDDLVHFFHTLIQNVIDDQIIILVHKFRPSLRTLHTTLDDYR